MLHEYRQNEGMPVVCGLCRLERRAAVREDDIARVAVGVCALLTSKEDLRRKKE